MISLHDFLNIPVWIALVAVLLVAFYFYGIQNQSVWKNLGIPGPKPLPFIGNAHDIRRLGMPEAFQKWIDIYGPVVGVYFMRRPMLLVSDVNMLKRILVSDFNNFVNRGSPIPKSFVDGDLGQCLLFLDNDEWRRIRSILTPIFTASRLRSKEIFINKAAEKAVQTMLDTGKKHEPVAINEVFRTYTIDVILGTLLSVHPEDNGSVVDMFARYVPKMVRPSPFRLKMFMLASMFPILSPILGKLADESKEARQFYTSFISQMAEQRKGAPEGTYKDFLENMAEAEGDGSGVKLTFRELIAQTSLFFIAGNDTSSLVLTVLGYLLAQHQDIQDRLVEEIYREIHSFNSSYNGDNNVNPTMDRDTPSYNNNSQDRDIANEIDNSKFKEKIENKKKKERDEINYDTIQRLTLLRACVLEALRLHPVISVFTRQAIHDTEIAGYPIPAGAGIYVPIKTICNDPDIYPEPHLFRPERFLKGHLENQVLDSLGGDAGGAGSNPAAYLPFGIGPRNCIGARLGIFQVMMVMAKVLPSVRFVSASAEFKLPKAIMFGIPPFKDPVLIDIEPR